MSENVKNAKRPAKPKETVFSKHLKQYLKEHEITVAELAAEVGMDRVNVYRYIEGRRFPEDIEIVEKMLGALRMRNAERQVILEQYERVKLGNQIVDSHKYVENLMHDLMDISKKKWPDIQTWSQFVHMPLENQIHCLGSRKEIEMCAAALFEAVAQNAEEGDEVYLLMQPTYKVLQELLISSFRDTIVKLEQIICLEQNPQKNYRNLKAFRQLLPTCFANMDYHVRYYYSMLTEHINEMSWMPNMILTELGVLQFDYAMENGVFVGNKAYVNSVKKQYTAFQKSSVPFLIKTEGLDCTQQLYSSMLEDFKSPIGRDDKTVNTLFVQPCLGMCVSSDMYENYLYPSPIKEMFTMGMAATRGDWHGIEHLHSGQNLPLKTVNYFQLKGLNDFMETGRIREFPSAFYSPLSEQDRKMCVKRMFKLLEEGAMKYRIVSDSVKMPQNMCFYLGGELMFVNLIENDSFIQIQIEERGICQVFRQHLEYLESKELLLDEENSMNALKKYSQNMGIDWEN